MRKSSTATVAPIALKGIAAIARTIATHEPDAITNRDLSTTFDKLINTDIRSADLAKEQAGDIEFELTQRDDGRYEVALPLKNGAIPINNFRQAYRRLIQTQNRLKKRGIFTAYESAIMEYVNAGHAKRVTTSNPQLDIASYFPHQEVIKLASETTKFRVVFDGSAGPDSINKWLVKGEFDMNLVERMMDFRMKGIAITSDVEKAFLQIAIKECDQDWLRFIWLKDGQLQVYKMTRVPFGITSAPAILAKTIRAQLLKYKDKFPGTVVRLLNSFYMDDLVTSLHSLEEARMLKAEAEIIFQDAKLNLHKWRTNSQELRKSFNEKEHNPQAKVLGLIWNQDKDIVSLNVELPKVKTFSKRTALKITNSIFDPIGIIEPVRLKLKQLIQQLWSIKSSWDEPIPDEWANEFETFLKSAPLLSQVKIPRMFCKSEAVMVSFFSDACQTGYGMVVFITTAAGVNNLVQAKSRVAPLKEAKGSRAKKGSNSKSPARGRTIPELELTALTEAVEAIPFFANLFPSLPIYAWSDSEITLKRIRKEINKGGAYVENRVARIHAVCQNHKVNFRKIGSKENPADDYSRPLSVEEFLEKRSFECQLNLLELANVAEAYEVPKYDVIAAINAPPPGSTSEAVEKGKS